MKLDWDAMQPPSDHYNYLASFLWKLQELMGDTTPSGARAYAVVVRANGYTGELMTAPLPADMHHAVYNTRYDHRTAEQHLLAMTCFADQYVWIAEHGDVEEYRIWYGQSYNMIPKNYNEVQTNGWDLV